MKRNEKILVYAVTGFLLVILGVAILFGNKDMAPRPDRSTTADGGGLTLEDLMRERVEGGKPASPDHETDAGTEDGGLEPADMGKTDPQDGGGAGKDVGEVPLEVRPPSPTEEVATLLGASRRERDFRIVTVQKGDSFRGLVQKWCGTLQGHVEAAERLNETLADRPLTPGQALVLPWVDEGVILEAYRKREAGEPVPVPAVATPAGEAMRVYTVQEGDSVWRIAVREVGAKAAPAYIERIKELNPTIRNIDLLKVGQELRLPARSEG